MKKINNYFTLLLAILFIANSFAQSEKNSTVLPNEISGTVIEFINQQPLPYVSIINTKNNNGVVSNEQGVFVIETDQLSETDTIRFQSIGFKTQNITIKDLASNSTIELIEDVYEIDEVILLSGDLDPEKIVKGVLEHRISNYLGQITKSNAFIRERYFSDFDSFDIDYKKSSISSLDKEEIQQFEEHFPKNHATFYDNLTTVYSNKTTDQHNFKIKPIRGVILKEKDIAELDYFETTMDSLFENMEEKEYWKIKSGIFAQKLNYEQEETTNETKTTELKDTVETKYLGITVGNLKKFIAFEDETKWDFLHNTNRYNFELEGGTSFGDEDAYIIHFEPKRKGKYTGKLYISMDNYALLRADYSYAEGKIGRNFQVLGIGFTQQNFSGSIYFEKQGEQYQLKYFSYRNVEQFRLDRKVALIKKRKRFLTDKKLNEIKVGLNIIVTSESSVEYATIKSELIDQNTFDNFTQPEKFKVIYVDQFDENLWKGYNIIEPTEKMKAYKKQF